MRNTLKITFILIAIVAFIMIVPNIVNAAEIIADPSKPETADLVEVVNNAETGSTGEGSYKGWILPAQQVG